MFTALHALTQSATLMIVVAAEGDDLRVSITPTQAGDKTKPHKLQPLSLIASPAELDDGFAAAIQSWQAPKLSLQQQVEAANKAATDDTGETASASSKAASKETQKRSGPGRPRKNETTPASGEEKAGANQAGQQAGTPPNGDGEAPPAAAPLPAATTGAGAEPDAAAPAVAGSAASQPEIVLPPASNPAITAAVDTVTLDLF